MTLIFGQILFANFSTPTLAQNKNELPLVVIKLGISPPYKCAYVITGEINQNLYESFKNSLNEKRNSSDCTKDSTGKNAYSFIKTVILKTSTGGDLNAAFKIMKLIGYHKLITQIDSDLTEYCLSSCALIFASGNHRHWSINEDYKNSNHVLGIHKPDFVDGTYEHLNKEKALDKIKYEIIDYLSKVGIDPRFVIKMFETSNEKILYPKMQELLVWKTVTELGDPQYFKSLNLHIGSKKVLNVPHSMSGKKSSRPFAYFGWLLNNEVHSNQEDVDKVKEALHSIYNELNYRILDD